MKKSKSIIQNVFLFFMCLTTVMIFIGCDSSDDDDLLTDDPGNTTITPVEVSIDATNAETWIYFSFSSGTIVEISDPENSTDWDIALQKTIVKINGGSSGKGQGGAIVLEGKTFDQISESATTGFVSDSEESFAISAVSGEGWYNYTGPPNHWILPLEKIFILKTADGKFVKLQFIGYYKDNDKKEESGFVTIKFAFQPDGNATF